MSKSNLTAIALVANFKFLKNNFNRIYSQIREIGSYNGEIILITTYFCPTFLFKPIRNDKLIKIIRFRKVRFSAETESILKNLITHPDPNRHLTKNFQWHKIYLFSMRLKQWKYIFYLDINMHIHYNINPILKLRPKEKLLARADSYPRYDKTLENQFVRKNPYFYNLEKSYDLKISNYFQTGVLFFDTSIINEHSVSDIISLVEKFPISKTNEQGILNLYFLHNKAQYEELPLEINEVITYFYWKLKDRKVTITKATTTQNK